MIGYKGLILKAIFDGMVQLLPQVDLVSVAEEGVILSVDKHPIQVLGELGVHVKLEDVLLVGKLFEISKGHILEGLPPKSLFVLDLWQNVKRIQNRKSN